VRASGTLSFILERWVAADRSRAAARVGGPPRGWHFLATAGNGQCRKREARGGRESRRARLVGTCAVRRTRTDSCRFAYREARGARRVRTRYAYALRSGATYQCPYFDRVVANLTHGPLPVKRECILARGRRVLQAADADEVYVHLPSQPTSTSRSGRRFDDGPERSSSRDGPFPLGLFASASFGPIFVR